MLARWLLGALVLLLAGAMAASVVVSRPLFDERLDPAALDRVAIAPADQALTFARTRQEPRRLLLVTAFAAGTVTGADLGEALGADPVSRFRQLGYDGLLAAARSAPAVTVDAASLDVPFAAHERNVGVGLNYQEHAQESGLDEPPFFFPKYGQPTPFDSAIARDGSVLLDYEAELGLVLLEDVSPGAAARAPLGFVLANEMTDRWRLVRNFERGAPMGTTGFTDGKSRDGFAPLGPLLVIPRDANSFYGDITLKLYVNGRLRQREAARAMRWSPQRILEELFRHAGLQYRYQGQSVSLLGAGPALPAGTVVFSGTPAGVIFKPLNLWNPWVYLRPGDEVVLHADFLGAIRNRITE
jgi:2-keto-4-pentenoate hydratase/2-oxohepta-3-ene-1,7-dioic acid hydratase in catechol pathway